MTITLLKVVVASLTAWVFVVDATPVSVMHGDLCRRMNGRKYYLEADTHAVITATNVTLPAFPRIATQGINNPGSFLHHSSSRRHRREGPQEIGLIEPRFHRNITSISLSSLATSNRVVPKVFIPSAKSTRLLTPMRTPSLDTPPPPPPPPPPAPLSPLDALPTSSPLLMDEPEEDLESESDMTTTLSQPSKCGVEILTRPDCHLELTFDKVNLPSCSHDKSCRCDYVRLREPPYRGVGGLDVCSTGDETPDTFTTQTKEVRLDFLYTRHYEDAFTIGITAKRNKYRIIGKVNSTVGYIRSPFFPELYPKEHWMEYDLVAKDENTRLKVTFLDFQLSPWSFVEIQDTNKTRLAVFNGNLFRPPVLVSSGPHITVRFSGNGETARGFNLQYTFVDVASTAVIPPITDCGGYVTNFGGTITMMNMSSDDIHYTMYDCVWIVQPPQNYAFKSHLSIRVVQFEEMASATTLEIRQGLTSDDYLLERIEGDGPKQTQEHVVAVDTGFYVRLRGFFNKNSKLAIVYSSFSYLGSCYSMTDLMCHNHRCIPKMLRCDGFDHCGDNSDEPTSCYVGANNKGLTPEDAAWWYQHTPNYYFPQKSSFLGGQHGWSGVLLLTSLIVMVMLMLGLLSYMLKTGTERYRDGPRRTHSGVHSHRGSLIDDVEIIDASADDPPLYEPPPDYEEVIKVILSGNNLKLVRRPGGVTAWVPDKLAEEGGNRANQHKNDRPHRTRHHSLDLEEDMEVVLWNSNTSVTPRINNNVATAGNDSESNTSLNTNVPFRMGHVRRSSLPTAPPTPEIMQNDVQGHSVSVAPETVVETSEFPRSAIRHIHTLSSPQISLRSFNYETSVVSTPGPSTPQLSQTSPKIRKSKKFTKKGGKKKKLATARKPQLVEVRDDSAPPSYEDAMQQVIQSEVHPIASATEVLSGSETASQVNESTQTNIEPVTNINNEDLSPSDRVQAAREMFQRLSKEDQKLVQVAVEAHGGQYVAKRPAVQVNKTKLHKGLSSGGTISRGTVKARKAMLLKAQKHRRDCDCNGACSCAYFKPESPSEETPFTGGVKSKVKYYLTIEESTKKREHDSSIEQSTVEQESQTSQKLPDKLDHSNAVLKKRKLVRNQSAPIIGHIRERGADIYFSRNERMSDVGLPSPVEDMEQPLITPVTDTPRPVFIVPKNTLGKEELSEQEIVPSIQNRVKLYNELTKADSPSPVLPRTPSPAQLPVRGIRVNHMVRADSAESLDERNNSSITCMRSMKLASSDPNIKPGLVKEATSKFITTLASEIRPKLYPQDSDGSNDSPLPIRIPYLNLKNEVSSSPEICENDTLTLPPLPQEEAESIKFWNSILQGRSERRDVDQDAYKEEFPSPSSGAVPKKSVGEVTIHLNHQRDIRSSRNKEGQAVQKRSLVQNDKEVKSYLKLNLRDKFSPVSHTEKKDYGNFDHPPNSTPGCSRFILEEENLGPPIPVYESSSDDDALPPSPCRRKNLNDMLNETTLYSDIDFEASLKAASLQEPPVMVHPGCSTVQSKQIQELKAKKKFPVPSPRVSKAPQSKLTQNTQNSSVSSQPTTESQSKEEVRARASSPMSTATTSPVTSKTTSRTTSSSTSPTPTHSQSSNAKEWNCHH